MSASKSFVFAALAAGVVSSTEIKMTPYKKRDGIEKCTMVNTMFLPVTTFTSGVCKDMTQSGDVFDTSAMVTLQADGTSITWAEYGGSKNCTDGVIPTVPKTIPLDTCYESTVIWLKFTTGSAGGDGDSSSSPVLSVCVAVLTAVVARLLF